jgi:hypothetical protein
MKRNTFIVEVVPSMLMQSEDAELHLSAPSQTNGTGNVEDERTQAEAEGYVAAGVRLAEVKEAPNRRWKCLQVQKRSITFFHQDDHIYAMDRFTAPPTRLNLNK